jgi:hypothetical protein
MTKSSVQNAIAKKRTEFFQPVFVILTNPNQIQARAAAVVPLVLVQDVLTKST